MKWVVLALIILAIVLVFGLWRRAQAGALPRAGRSEQELPRPSSDD